MVEGNMAGNFESDVLLQTNSDGPQVLNVNGALTEDARIGITFGSSFPAPGRVLTNKLSENGSANGSAANFFLDSENPDSGNIDIILNNCGEAQLHTHEWYTSVSGDFSTFTVQCTAGGCEYADGVKAKIDVPFEGGSKIYDGEPVEAAVTFSDADGNPLEALPDWVAPGEIVYTRGDEEELEELPADAGSYKASVEYDALTGPYLPSIRVSFMIAPKPLTDGMVVLEPDVFQYDEEEKHPQKVVVANALETLEADKDYTLNEDSVLKITDAGEYSVAVTGIGNYTGTARASWRINQVNVTFRTVNGAWNDGTSADRTVKLDGSFLMLTEDQIPAVGDRPAEGAAAGAWDVTPDTETRITKNVTYTYYYLPAFGTADFILPDKTGTIGESAFEGIAAKTVKIQEGCRTIGPRAFAGCPTLEKVWIPDSVQDTGGTPGIADEAFAGCPHVFLYGTDGGAADTYCNGTDSQAGHINCTFVPVKIEN